MRCRASDILWCALPTWISWRVVSSRLLHVPSCIPARASLLTGLHPATSGVVGYAARPIPYPTLPKLLADAGYATALVGRSMHQLGIDLTPVLPGKTQKVREWLHSEHAPCYSQAQAFHALTDGRFKYIWRPLDGSEQFFNLKKDPREEHDLAKMADSATRVQEWRARSIKLLANRPEGFSEGKN
jgi:arylsulfatase A-like enzyme